ncbi:hypothetical protein Daesc_003544 [Daldinia eschscholtzii]|uniref:F-box domain-containing protein n=1 Tax=Daldinia eschscholtzii TaxID=292717 RepID=A0AAX6MTD1_9PEZI
MEHRVDSSRIVNIPINTQIQEPWDKMLDRIISYTLASKNCNQGSRYQVENRPSLRDYEDRPESNAKAAVRRLFDRTRDSWEQILKAQALAREAIPRYECGPLRKVIYSRESRIAAATPNKFMGSSIKAPNLLNLPCEVFERILQYTVGSYELNGELLRLNYHGYKYNRSTQLIFYKPRVWADLNVLQICRAFRNLAISYYGPPQENTLPFSPKLDAIVIQGEGLDPFGEDYYVRGVAYPPNLKLQNWNNDHWLHHDGAYMINEERSGVRPWSKVTRISDECLRRPTEITLDIYDGTIFKLKWQGVWDFLGRAFANTRCLKLNISQLDCCVFKASEESEEDPERRYVLHHDFYVFRGLCWALDDAPPNLLFPKLENLQLIKVADYCTRSWPSRYSSAINEKSMELLTMKLIDGTRYILLSKKCKGIITDLQNRVASWFRFAA